MKTPTNVKVHILKAATASSYPLLVECTLTDYHGNNHLFHGKLPYFSLEDNVFPPCEGEMRCMIVGETEEYVSIDISEPDDLESETGETKFTVRKDQIKAF